MLRLRLSQSLLRQATRLKLFEHERAGVYAREVRKASFNASQNGAPKNACIFWGEGAAARQAKPRFAIGLQANRGEPQGLANIGAPQSPWTLWGKAGATE